MRIRQIPKGCEFFKFILDKADNFFIISTVEQKDLQNSSMLQNVIF